LSQILGDINVLLDQFRLSNFNNLVDSAFYLEVFRSSFELALSDVVDLLKIFNTIEHLADFVC